MAWSRGRRAATVACAIAVAIVATPAVRRVLWPAPRPNVIVIVLDTLRADRVGATPPGRTPFLARWFADGVVYDRAYAASSWTVPSIASLFVAQFPSEHEVRVVSAILPEDCVTLAEVLTANGYVSGGFSTNLEITADAGFGQGFDTFDLVFKPPKDDAHSLNQAALGWLDEIAGRAQPVFLYLQYMEPHSPYRRHDGVTAPSAVAADDETLSRRINDGAYQLRDGDPLPAAWAFAPAELERVRQLYDGEVAYLDGALSELFAALDDRGLLRDALVVVTADHGEQLGEHGMFSHGNTLFEDTIHVPLLLKPPGAARPGHVTEPVSTAGLAPAILDALRIAPPPSFHVPALPLEETTGSRIVRSEAFKENPTFLLLHRQAVIGRTTKLLRDRDGREQLFDLAADPGELQPLTDAAFAAPLRAAAVALGDDPAVPPPAVDDATRKRLEALGYAH